MGLSLVPSVVITDSDWKKNVLKMVDVYESDLPFPHNMDTELFSWQTKWGNNVGKVPNKLQDTLAQTDDLYFPNIHTLLQIICTIPVTTGFIGKYCFIASLPWNGIIASSIACLQINIIGCIFPRQS